MTDIRNGQLTDLLLNESEYNTEIQALAYAMRLEKQRILDEADRTRTLAMIDQLPEKILDVLAVELRSPYYTEDMTIEQKRGVISNSLVWFYHAGTPSALVEMATVIFGSGQVVEWFDFDPNEGEIVPGEFDLETGAAMQDPQDFMGQINRIINRVKNTRSHLRMIKFLRTVHIPISGASLPQTYSRNTVRNIVNETLTAETPVASGAFPQAFQRVTIRNVLDELASPCAGFSAACFTQAVQMVTVQASA